MMIQKLKSYLESIEITPTNWLLGISGILMARFFLEAISSPTTSGIAASDASTLIHYYLFFMAFAFGSLLFFHFAIPKWREVLPQFVLYLFVAVLIAPILDFILSKGAGATMSYIFYTPKDLLYALFTFFGSANGITVGIRIEAAIIILFSGFLIYKIEKNILRAIIGATVLYLAIFIFVSLPSIVSMFGSIANPIHFFANAIANSATFPNNLHSALLYGYPARALEIGFNFVMGKIWFLITTALLGVWFYLSQKVKFIHIIKNSRPERVAFHLLAVSAGFYLANIISPIPLLVWNDYLSIVVLLISFYFSWMFAVCVNDIADEKIDEVSNSSRPLITKGLSHNDMKQASIIFLTVSLIGAFLAGYYAFFLVLAFTSLYYIYSAPPARFKSIPFFSSFLIGLCVLTEVMAGFFLLSESKLMAAFPTKVIAAIVISVFLWSNIRDLKDVEGDSKEDIKTVPVLFGSVWGPRITGIMAATAFLLVPLFAGTNFLFLISVPAAIFTYYFCVRKPYNEKFVFLAYFIFVLTLLFLLVFN